MGTKEIIVIADHLNLSQGIQQLRGGAEMYFAFTANSGNPAVLFDHQRALTADTFKAHIRGVEAVSELIDDGPIYCGKVTCRDDIPRFTVAPESAGQSLKKLEKGLRKIGKAVQGPAALLDKSEASLPAGVIAEARPGKSKFNKSLYASINKDLKSLEKAESVAETRKELNKLLKHTGQWLAKNNGRHREKHAEKLSRLTTIRNRAGQQLARLLRDSGLKPTKEERGHKQSIAFDKLIPTDAVESDAQKAQRIEEMTELVEDSPKLGTQFYNALLQSGITPSARQLNVVTFDVNELMGEEDEQGYLTGDEGSLLTALDELAFLHTHINTLRAQDVENEVELEDHISETLLMEKQARLGDTLYKKFGVVLSPKMVAESKATLLETIDNDLANQTAPTLFSGISATSKQTHSYLRALGVAYEEEVLRDSVREIIGAKKGLHLVHLKRKRDSEGATEDQKRAYQEGLAELDRMYQALMDRVFKGPAAIRAVPAGLCDIVGAVYNKAYAASSDHDAAYDAAQRALMLHFVNAVFFSSLSKGAPIGKMIKGNAPISFTQIMLAKMLQSQSSRVDVGARETEMAVIQPTLDRNAELFQSFMEGVITRGGGELKG